MRHGEIEMRGKCLLLILFGLFFIVPLNACDVGDNPEGACVNIAGGCGDDFTSAQCDAVNGAFHEDTTCDQLGFR
jgi:hypothetical protein